MRRYTYNLYTFLRCHNQDILVGNHFDTGYPKTPSCIGYIHLLWNNSHTYNNLGIEPEFFYPLPCTRSKRGCFFIHEHVQGLMGDFNFHPLPCTRSEGRCYFLSMNMYKVLREVLFFIHEYAQGMKGGVIFYP